MTAPVAGDAQTYADFAGLDALKRSAANRDPGAVRAVARQFEALFARMMIKSMRDASGTDPLFGSDQQKMYEGMYDDQLSLDLTRGRGLGLADMLVRQLQRLGTAAAGTSGQAAGAVPAANASQRAAPVSQPTPASAAEQQSFVSELWPAAQAAGRELGIDPRHLIAQAALETSWGRSLPRTTSGNSSDNLFGVKASPQWAGPTVTAPTVEYHNGAAVSGTGTFRAYGSKEQSLQNYVELLRANPRYAAALNTGGDAQAFGAALQRAGYATDPNYASKISAIAAGLAGAMAPELKVASALPITAGTGTL